MDMLVSHGTELARALHATLPADEPYLLLPEPLALDLRDSPLAVGIYLLVGRAFLVHQGPIPLSATDIQAYNGSGDLLRGAILRALTRLCKGGYLLRQSAQERGLKATYLPGWGRVGGEAHPWSFDAACLDRPRSVRAVRIPRVLIDVCLGRITPHQRHAALIDRYVTRPPVSLRDLGAYGLSWAGIPTPTPALTRLGLISPTGPLPPPPWAQLLARISQQPLFDADPEAPTLSLRGLQRAGFTVAPTTPAPDSPPLFFVPTDMIGGMISTLSSQVIAQRIGMSSESETDLSASGSTETPISHAAETTTGTQGNSGISGNEATSPSTASAEAKAKAESSSRLPSETAKRLPTQPSMVNASPMPQTIPPAAAPATTPAEEMLRELGVYPSVARQHCDLSLALIERAQTIAQRLPGRRSLAATIVQLLHEEQASPGWLRNGRPDLFLGPMRNEEETAADPEEAAPDEDDALSVVAAQIGLRVTMPAEAVVAPAPQAPAPIRASITIPAPKSERPDWINPEQWAQLHLIARGALSGSRWVDGEIVGAGPGTTRLLRGSLASLVARLNIVAESDTRLEKTTPPCG
jgi:hypothetical protein